MAIDVHVHPDLTHVFFVRTILSAWAIKRLAESDYNEAPVLVNVELRLRYLPRHHGFFPIIAFAAKAVTIPNGRFTSSR
jgi:hypothetical protein